LVRFQNDELVREHAAKWDLTTGDEWTSQPEHAGPHRSTHWVTIKSYDYALVEIAVALNDAAARVESGTFVADGPRSIVMNTHDSSQGGSHWFAVTFDIDEKDASTAAGEQAGAEDHEEAEDGDAMHVDPGQPICAIATTPTPPATPPPPKPASLTNPPTAPSAKRGRSSTVPGTPDSFLFSTAMSNFSRRCGRSRRSELGNGECGFRAVIRQYLAAVEDHYLPDTLHAVTFAMVRRMTRMVGLSLELHAAQIAADGIVGTGDTGEPRRQRRRALGLTVGASREERQEEATAMLRRRGDAMVQGKLEPGGGDMGNWLGGRNNADHYALAFLLREQGLALYVITRDRPTVTVYSEGEVEFQSLDVIQPAPRDVVIEYDGALHYDSWVARSRCTIISAPPPPKKRRQRRD